MSTHPRRRKRKISNFFSKAISKLAALFVPKRLKLQNDTKTEGTINTSRSAKKTIKKKTLLSNKKASETIIDLSLTTSCDGQAEDEDADNNCIVRNLDFLNALKENRMINDEAINLWVNDVAPLSLASRFDVHEIAVVSTFFFTALSHNWTVRNNAFCYEAARPWIKGLLKTNFKQNKKILIPIHVPHRIHWILAVVDPRSLFKKQNISAITIYDSCLAHFNAVTIKYIGNLLREFFTAAFKERFGPANANYLNQTCNFSTIKVLQDIPQQHNGIDCGVFVCMFMEQFLLGKTTLQCLKNQMKHNPEAFVVQFRQKMATRIQKLIGSL